MRGFVTLIISICCIATLANIRVLSIGISEYPETSGWNKISAHNDVELMHSIFPNAIFLENASATRSGIQAQLNLLTNSVTKGDTVIIHFSGHGQQILTPKSKKEADGVDEALVPFDAGKRKTGKYTGEHHLTDNAFGQEIDNIRKSVGPEGLVIAVIDACHSDSMDKDADDSKEIYRGTDEIFGAEDMSDEEISVLRESYHNQETNDLIESSELSNVIYISACRSDQRNYEVTADGKGYGSLTYYFCNAYKANGISDLSQFLSALYSGMANDQTLRFHGQVPSIRNTVGWDTPSKVVAPLPKPLTAPDDSDNTTNQTFIWGIIAIAFIVIFIALWITRKKKK